MSNKSFLVLIGMLIVVAIGYIAFGVKRTPLPKAAPVVASLSSLSIAPAPWQPEYNNLPNRLKVIGLSLLGAEGTAQHIHSHLDIFINDQRVIVPADIGIPPTGGLTPVHTHDTSGIIHIESPDAYAIYTLGQFFDIWGVKFTNTSLGSYADNSTDTLNVYSDGKKVNNPVNLALKAHEEIAITYGLSKQSLHIPKSYNFPAGM